MAHCSFTSVASSFSILEKAVLKIHVDKYLPESQLFFIQINFEVPTKGTKPSKEWEGLGGPRGAEVSPVTDFSSSYCYYYCLELPPRPTLIIIQTFPG